MQGETVKIVAIVIVAFSLICFTIMALTLQGCGEGGTQPHTAADTASEKPSTDGDEPTAPSQEKAFFPSYDIEACPPLPMKSSNVIDQMKKVQQYMVEQYEFILKPDHDEALYETIASIVKSGQDDTSASCQDLRALEQKEQEMRAADDRLWGESKSIAEQERKAIEVWCDEAPNCPYCFWHHVDKLEYLMDTAANDKYKRGERLRQLHGLNTGFPYPYDSASLCK